MTRWITCRIGDLCTLRRGASPRPINNFISTEGVPWVKIADATESKTRFIEKTKEFIKEEGAKNSVAVTPGTLILSNSATPGLPKIMKINACVHDGWLVFDDFNGITRDFLYYLFLNERERLVQGANGSVFNNLKTDIVKNFIVRIPESIAIQNRIVSILSSIDDKIELNLKINETLEEMAMTLYKHWFVDFGPFQDGEFVESELGMIPKGWRVISCYDLANYINGKAFKTNQLVDNDGLPVIKIAELKSGITNSTKFYNGDIEPKYLLQNGDILFAWSASLGVFIWAKGKAVLNQHIFNVKPNGTLSKSMIYFTLKNIIQEFIEIAASRATTMGHITKEHLIDKKIALPPDELLVKVDEKMSNYYQMILSNMLEVERLTQIRDYLLPRLLSGEIDVSKAEKQVEEVL
ncbi:restriction endonuclease subunit S [Geobacillus sp. FSL K6-0789]|uniref:Restriction endonuclease subunit S n=1 Tax=Geobacillus stearothermophilus TaxID=1422 RepID=A0A3L7CUL2_GEOSE|nr:restriction endonuclease subunit S [Geobacillus stearothermophilus]RLQ07623.1 restriction endonuclease subunit S [Geobacillus stearothermophilus]RLQ09517.1 restriction endonuclease subunit S [Geobacillus stearothermophilus]RLQ13705.1 restriction endonuclease subunit S [Geobacillus stearothermophilus]